MIHPDVLEIAQIIEAFGHDTANCGFPIEEIKEVEEALREKLPKVLFDFYAHLGNHPIYKNRGAYEYNIRNLSSLHIPDVDGYITLFGEGGGYSSVWECIKVEELSKPNPESHFWVVDSPYDRHPLLEGLQNVTFANLTAPHHLKKAYYTNVTQVSDFTAGLPETIPNEIYITPELYVQTAQTSEHHYDITIGASSPQGLLDFMRQPSIQQHQALVKEVWLNITPNDKVDLALLESFSPQQLEKLYYDNRQVSLEELKQMIKK
jgi:hypothetical protein